ncbi:MAG: hypothetical protein ACI9MF_000760, partial [Gammaproteobacteria bacterium]
MPTSNQDTQWPKYHDHLFQHAKLMFKPVQPQTPVG